MAVAGVILLLGYFNALSITSVEVSQSNSRPGR